MSLTISTIRDALKAQLNLVLAGREQNVKAYRQGGSPGFPLITIEPAPDYIDYWLTMSPNGATSGGLSAVRFVIVVQAGAPADESARRRLDDFLSVGTGNASSVIDAVMSDVSLGGVVETCHIPRAEVDDDTATGRLFIEVVCRKQGANA